MKKEVKNWLDSAQYDLETAKHMFNSGRYIYTVFMCHLALEKAIKAKVEEVTDKILPKIHDLEYLMSLAGLSPDKDIEKFIAEITNLSVIMRYPSDFQKILKDLSKERAKLTLTKTKEAFQWIMKYITL